MSKIHSVVCLIVGIATCAYAGSESSPIYVLAIQDVKPVSVTLVRQADYVAIPVSITSDQKEPVMRFNDIRVAKRLIQEKSKEHKGLVVKEGVLSLSARPNSKMSFLSSCSYESPSTAQLSIMMPIDSKSPDVFSTAAEITRFINSIKFGEKTECQLGHLELAVADPEQYRPTLLQLIAQDVRKTKEQMGVKGTLMVQGLQSPVMVRQLDETRVELLINYAVSLNWTE